MQITLTNALTAQKDIGRSRIFYAVTTSGGSVPTVWDGASELYLKWLCDTEGDLVQAPNETINRLIPTELTAAPIKAYASGEAPVITIPAYLADPDLRAIMSPTNNASGGTSAQRPVAERTLAIFVEELFFNSTTGEHDLTLDSNGGSWLLGGVAMTGRKAELFGLTAWLWRGFFRRASTSYKWTDGGKAVEPVEFELMIDSSKPEHNMLYTIGDPYLAPDGTR